MISADGGRRPMNSDHSYRVVRPLTLTYAVIAGEDHKTIGVGEHLWHVRASSRGPAVFIDMDGELGSAAVRDPNELCTDGVLRLTGSWISWGEALRCRDLCHIPKSDYDNGDALERLGRNVDRR